MSNLYFLCMWTCVCCWFLGLGVSAGWAVTCAVHHGRVRPRASDFCSRAPSRSPRDSWHQYIGSWAQTPSHAPWATCNHKGPYAGRHRGALWHLGESLKYVTLFCCTIAKKHPLFSSKQQSVTGCHGNCTMLNAWKKLGQTFFVMSEFVHFIVVVSLPPNLSLKLCQTCCTRVIYYTVFLPLGPNNNLWGISWKPQTPDIYILAHWNVDDVLFFRY